MAWVSALLSAAGHGGDRAAQVAACLRRLKTPAADGTDGERGRILRESRPAWYVQGEAAGLGPVMVAYERQGSGEPVVLLHGLGCHRQTWDPVIPLLTDRREIIAMDLPGFGQSPDLDPGVPIGRLGKGGERRLVSQRRAERRPQRQVRTARHLSFDAK